MPVRALRLYENFCWSHALIRVLKTMNAREGIKTFRSWTTSWSWMRRLKTMNAREGIKTYDSNPDSYILFFR